MTAQLDRYLAERSSCPACGRVYCCKSHHDIVIRSLFGTLRARSPRFRHCTCQDHAAGSFSPLTERLPERILPERRLRDTLERRMATGAGNELYVYLDANREQRGGGTLLSAMITGRKTLRGLPLDVTVAEQAATATPEEAIARSAAQPAPAAAEFRER